jgi:signal peptidase I
MTNLPVWAEWLLLLVSVALMAASVWVTADAARRGRRWVAWMWASIVFGLLGVITWLFSRRRTRVLTGVAGPTLLQACFLVIPLEILLGLGMEEIRRSYVQVARIEGQNMSPTLRDQDRLLINKAIYDVTLPKRGEIVMLYYPSNPDKSFVKRIIGLPGDVIEIRSGLVVLNGHPLEEPYVVPEHRSREQWGPKTIDEAYYFVMGDRRNNGFDSRHWGLVPRKYIVGRVAYRWYPSGDMRSDWGTPTVQATTIAR